VSYRNLMLAGVVTIELIAGAALAMRQKPPVTPVVADLSHVDSFAAAHIRELIAKCQSPDDWAGLGEVYLAYGYFTEAEACYRVAVAKQSGRTDWAHHWGFALERIGRIAEANAQYERAIELGHPDPTGCWYYIGRNHLRLENLDAARSAFEKAGDQPSARYEIARLLVRADRADRALPILDRLTSEYPDAIQPPLLRHKIEILGGTSGATASGLQSMYTLSNLPSPFDADWKWLEGVHDNMGLARELKTALALYQQGNRAAATPILQEVYRQNGDVIAVGLLAAAEERNGHSTAATQLLEGAIGRIGPVPHLLIILGEAHMAAGRPDLAEQAWIRATQRGIGDQVKDAYHQLARYYEKAEKPAEARRNFALAYLAAGHEAFWKAQPADTRTMLEKAIEYEPRLAPAWFYLGEMHRLQGEADPARKAYQRCLSIDPNFGRAITGLSLLSK
jgi:tetratricopeptide (TPR) repeat protein